ncbi:MAG TPA: Piwi domain-containing protein [Steroidobacteraceae bacterium]
MSVFLNAFPLTIPDAEVTARVIPYADGRLQELREEYGATHAFRRRGEEILIFSADRNWPLPGTDRKIRLREDFDVFRYLVKDGLTRHLAALGRRPLGFHPIELISTKPEDNLTAPIFGAQYPFRVTVRYSLDTRIVVGRVCLIIDSATSQSVGENCAYFLSRNFSLNGLHVTTEKKDGYRSYLGVVTGAQGSTLTVRLPDDTVKEVAASEVYLEAGIANSNTYLSHTHPGKEEELIERIRSTVSSFNVGQNKMDRIDTLKKYFQQKGIDLLTRQHVEVESTDDISPRTGALDRSVFIFNDNGEARWAEAGLKDFGPYTKRTFDKNDPSICVICAQGDKGRVEVFVRKFLKGIPGAQYFANGLEGKFSVGTSRVEFFTTPTDTISGHRFAIETAIKKKRDDGGKWDLALIQVRQRFKELEVADSPYYLGKSLFFLHQVPVQDFTIELLSQTDRNLGYSLNNMALASYAKMGGVPWLLKSSPTISHELVVGIGSANIGEGRGVRKRIMGITTVFSGDGSYIVSNNSKAVPPEHYCSELTSVLFETIEKIKSKMNWQRGDTIRLVFHASVKKFNQDEIEAVRSVMEHYREYQIEYAFLKISADHGLHMFDTSTQDADKGKFAPLRGRTYKLSDYQMLVYLIGGRELKTPTDGHPRGLILEIHKDSTFKDLKYLTTQLFNFASHSWRSYFPNPMPVTITYSDLIAKILGWLNQLDGWNDATMMGRIGHTQWFL